MKWDGFLVFDIGRSSKNSRHLALSFFVMPRAVMKSGATIHWPIYNQSQSSGRYAGRHTAGNCEDNPNVKGFYDLPLILGVSLGGFYPPPYSLDNLTPADVYFGRAKEVLSKRDEIKKKTLQQRRLQNLQFAAV